MTDSTAQAGDQPLQHSGEANTADADATRQRPVLVLYAATLFLSALLLFSVQPVFAKMVLPRLGGTPAVWSVAMVFFQAMLLAGYLYAHILIRRVGLLTGTLIHAVVVAIAVFWLPFEISTRFGDIPQTGVPFWLLILFTASIGAPFFAVAANAPLLQAWFARTGHRHSGDPYFLYGASNLGSFIALLSYPVIFEPLMRLGDQSRLWSAGYIVLGLAFAVCGLVAFRRAGAQTRTESATRTKPPRSQVTTAQRLPWIALSLLPSALLVAVTAHISTNVAAAPLLWVMPLALFLLTFVITFQRRPIIPHRFACLALPFLVVGAGALLVLPTGLGIAGDTLVHLLAFFVAGLVCHGELVSRRPAADHLTEFYLLMSVGGVLGGAFATLAAPVLFTTVVEYPVLLGLSLLAIPDMRQLIHDRWKLVVPLLAVGALALAFSPSDVVTRERSFFGVITVDHTEDGRFRRFAHGTTVHGAQAATGPEATGALPVPVTYYAEDGPLAGAIKIHRASQIGASGMNVGIVGLGVGSLLCYGTPADKWWLYEIDPGVVTIAADRKYFRFMSDCPPPHHTVLGDARLTVAREADRTFDVLVIDAFSSDAIPVHLFTTQAIALYMTKLRPGGVLVMHVSNNFMELKSVLAANAKSLGLAGAGRVHHRTAAEHEALRFDSEAVVLAADPATLARFNDAGWTPLAGQGQPAAPWTDDYSNILSAILRKSGF